MECDTSKILRRRNGLRPSRNQALSPCSTSTNSGGGPCLPLARMASVQIAQVQPQTHILGVEAEH